MLNREFHLLLTILIQRHVLRPGSELVVLHLPGEPSDRRESELDRGTAEPLLQQMSTVLADEGQVKVGAVPKLPTQTTKRSSPVGQERGERGDPTASSIRVIRRALEACSPVFR